MQLSTFQKGSSGTKARFSRRLVSPPHLDYYERISVFSAFMVNFLRDPKMHLCLLVIAAFLAISCLSKKPPETNADVMLETDDRATAATAQLVDVEAIINAHINKVLSEVRAEKTPIDKKWTYAAKADFLKEVAKRLAGPRRGSGVGVGSGAFRIEVSVLTEIEAWLIENLSPEKREIVFVPFEKSLYGDNPIGAFKAKVPSHSSVATANHSIAPVIKVRGVLLGIDKLAHFLEQGYWYYDATNRLELVSQKDRWEFGAFMEGHPNVRKELYPKYKELFGFYCGACVIAGGFGYYGSASTGVISNADLAANEDGYLFYKNLSQNISDYEFDLSTFNLKTWNEQNNKSLYIPGLVVKPK